MKDLGQCTSPRSSERLGPGALGVSPASVSFWMRTRLQASGLKAEHQGGRVRRESLEQPAAKVKALRSQGAGAAWVPGLLAMAHRPPGCSPGAEVFICPNQQRRLRAICRSGLPEEASEIRTAVPSWGHASEQGQVGSCWSCTGGSARPLLQTAGWPAWRAPVAQGGACFRGLGAWSRGHSASGGGREGRRLGEEGARGPSWGTGS